MTQQPVSVNKLCVQGTKESYERKIFKEDQRMQSQL